MTITMEPPAHERHVEARGSPVGEALRQTLSVQVIRGPRAAVVVVDGELDVATAPTLVDVVDELTDTGTYHRIVLDLTGVRFVDLFGLRTVDALAGPTVTVSPGAALHRLRDRLGAARTR